MMLKHIHKTFSLNKLSIGFSFSGLAREKKWCFDHGTAILSKTCSNLTGQCKWSVNGRSDPVGRVSQRAPSAVAIS